MVRIVAVIVVMLGTASCRTYAQSNEKTEVIRLFNGNTLDGWEGYPDHWSVRDGVIVGKNTSPVPVSTYLVTKRSFRDFHLKFASKLVQSEMHSGVALWGRVDANAPPMDKRARSKYTYAGHLVMFPSDWGLYDLFGRNGLKCDNAPAKKVSKQHDWNEMELFAQGDRIRLIANGVFVLDWREPEPARIKAAPVGLQLHSNSVPQEVHFRGLVLTTHPDDKRLDGKSVGDAIR